MTFDSEFCPTCGYCTDNGDCDTYGCGRKNYDADLHSIERIEKVIRYMCEIGKLPNRKRNDATQGDCSGVSRPLS